MEPGGLEMIGYGFGHDEELPAGFQDADLEMREWEDRSEFERELERESREEQRLENFRD
jgi:hypothetical protein